MIVYVGEGSADILDVIFPSHFVMLIVSRRIMHVIVAIKLGFRMRVK